MDFHGNEHDRVNKTLIPSSSAIFKTPLKTNDKTKDISILSGGNSWVENGAQSEQVLRAKSTGERRRVMSDSKSQGSLRSQTMSDPPTTLLHDVGNIFHEVFQLKKGCYADLPPAKISELMSNSLDKAPTQSLLSIVNGILDENLERRNGEIPHSVACLLSKVVREIERRVATQSEHLKMHNSLFKAREEKYKSRIQVLEAIAAATGEEAKTIMEDKAKIEAQQVKEKHDKIQEIAFLKQDREAARKTYEQRCLQIEFEARLAQHELEQKLKEALNNLTESRKIIKELETVSESKSRDWNEKENIYRSITDFQLGALQDLRFSSHSIRQEVEKTQNIYREEFEYLGGKVQALENAARKYYDVLAENQKLHNVVQELRGNIRVYCRIRPFPQKEEKLSSIESIGQNGEVIVKNPFKPGKEARRLFKFNKIYGPSSTQDEVFSDIQPLVQSVLDGYNVCIFAYGQTGSGKTYTMTGPYGATEEQWGVNYRALNDLFHISRTRESTFTYEIGVQIVEIYNEQVRDLLSSSPSQKKLGILSTSQDNGLSVPDASMYSVNSTSDVLELMDIGLKNRAQGSTTLNERSSRSHSIITIHVRGTDLKTGSSSRSSLHLVDLAGSERVDRSEVTGDRLKETQHINKSLSALGDVIFALAQKNSHVPYRNSKLTQVLQSSLGGQAKTLMFVQLNPDSASHSETVSTLKFAERVSGVELGAAKSSKDGMDVRELMEQVTSLKDMVARKDEEIERLQLLKDLKHVYPGVGCVKQFPASQRYGSSSSSLSDTKSLKGDTMQGNVFGGEDSGIDEKADTDQDKYSEASSEQHSDAISQNYDSDVIRHCKELEYFHQQQINTTSQCNVVYSLTANAEHLGFRGNAENEKRLSNASNSDLSVGTEPFDFNESKSMGRVGANTSKKKERPNTTSRISRASSRSPMDSTDLRKSSSGTNLSTKTSRKWH